MQLRDAASHCKTARVAVLSATENTAEMLRRHKGRSETKIESSPNMQLSTPVAAEECTTVGAEEGPKIKHVARKRFLGVRSVTVSAHLRHIQENAFLLQVKDHQEWDRAKLAAV